MDKEKKTCCFFGHRKITDADILKIKVYKVMENLILHNNVDTFLMGSKSDLLDYQPKSGTDIAYHYAVKKKKEIINVAEQPKKDNFTA